MVPSVDLMVQLSYFRNPRWRLTLVHAFVTSRVDYCNAVYAGAPKTITDKLQRVLNAAALVVSDTEV